MNQKVFDKAARKQRIYKSAYRKGRQEGIVLGGLAILIVWIVYHFLAQAYPPV